MGGIASGKARRRKSDMRSLALSMLGDPARGKAAASIAGSFPSLDGEATVAAQLVAAQIVEASRGSTKAASFLAGLQGEAQEADGDDGGAGSRYDLAALIGPDFLAPHRAIASGSVTDVWLRGGRGSLKSSFASLELVHLLHIHEDWHALVTMAHAVDLRDAAFAQVRWAIEALGLDGEWRYAPSARRMTNVRTGQLIYFRGLDKPMKVKSLKPPFGHIAIEWFEEADQLRGPADIRMVIQSATRGGEGALRLYSYNPPRTIDSWVNRLVDGYAADPPDGVMVCDSCYTHAPREWLGEQFFRDAEALKAQDEMAYRHEYLGEPVGTGAEVFDRAEYRAIFDDEIRAFDVFLAGQDFGWSPDPWAFVLLAWDADSRTLYALREDGGCKLTPPEQAERIREALTWADPEPDGRRSKPVCHDLRVLSDDADPQSIASQRDSGVKAVAAGKGGMRDASYRWLSSVRWVIDPARCPRLAEEARSLRHETDRRTGEVLPTIPDGNDHWIDASRYAVMGIVRRARKAYRGAADRR